MVPAAWGKFRPILVLYVLLCSIQKPIHNSKVDGWSYKKHKRAAILIISFSYTLYIVQYYITA